MRSIEQLTEELLSLPSASRALLAEKLAESLEFDIDPIIQGQSRLQLSEIVGLQTILFCNRVLSFAKLAVIRSTQHLRDTSDKN